jgi:hypothetical protein
VWDDARITIGSIAGVKLLKLGTPTHVLSEDEQNEIRELFQQAGSQ